MTVGVLVASICLGQDNFKTNKISIFKDGSSFVQSKGTVKPIKGVFTIPEKEIPKALFGTYWISNSRGKIKEIMATSDTVISYQKTNALTIGELLLANKGKDVKITTTENIEGNIDDVISLNSDKEQFDSITMNRKILLVAVPHIVMLKLKDGSTSCIPIETIKKLVVINNMKYEYIRKQQKQENGLKIKFNDESAVQDLDMMYLQQGLSWTPFYNLELMADGKAKLQLRAEVVNKASNILNADINFVVGVPNFKFSDNLTGLVNFLNIENKKNNESLLSSQSQIFSNSIVQSGINADPGPDAEEPELSLDNKSKAENEEDLYFYSVKNVSLNKNARAHFQLFNETIDYDHLYECALPPNKERYFYFSDFQQDQKVINEVTHSIRFKNQTTNPFTSGPVLVTKQTENGVVPLSQDLLKYTPAKGSSSIILTKASDIQITHAEHEKERVINYKKWNNNFYDMFKVEAKVKLKNFKNQDVKVQLSRLVFGVMDNSDIKYIIKENKPTSFYQNKLNLVTWEVELKAGEEKDFFYYFDYYYQRM